MCQSAATDYNVVCSFPNELLMLSISHLILHPLDLVLNRLYFYQRISHVLPDVAAQLV